MYELPKIDPEFKGLIPPLTAEEREQLEQNIKQDRRCYDAIVVWKEEGVIIDGIARLETCEKYGIQFEVVEISLPSREAAKLWILDNQLSRRNLNTAARIELVLLKEEILRKIAKKNLSDAGKKRKEPLSPPSKAEITPLHVRKAMANEAHVGEATLQRYVDIKKHGNPELLEQVQSGELKIKTAHRILEAKKQLKVASQWYKGISLCPQTPEIQAKLTALTAQAEQLLNKLEERRISHDELKNQPQFQEANPAPV